MTDRTEELFRADSYLTQCEATVLAVNERGGIILDRTVFYPTGGGQPGDSGTLTRADGTVIRIATTLHGDGDIIHVPEADQPPPTAGETLACAIDWEPRHKLMRMHTTMHLMLALIPRPINGCQVGADKSRIDFDLGDFALDKEKLETDLNALAAADHPVVATWITDAELEARPDLIRTMSVAPPRGHGTVRLIKIGEDVDLQPCGGTHVARTGEIGRLRIGKVENKGAHNKRIAVHLEG
ncbi:alanyl-tRNA editing protein [Marivibrio halodurans]|uniref:Alanine--tRNA ligase n=1 Tax=Marivibrio halodurans TaxID=2039722 RepID=A0A8J7S514_9PROT|nr:alanyl-tRNA editing protein [Marivibrio halodurans]MBP5856884.1 alanyl-tRNA editing protein [Marivibrio halodurans]